MPYFKVTSKSDRIPDVVLNAPDDIYLAEQIARHLIRHRCLHAGVPFEVDIDTTTATTTSHATFMQRGINSHITLTVSIEEQS